jgi:L-idonate 5-dehydrogenase
MQAVMCAGAGQLYVEKQPKPDISAGMIRAKIAFGGICGSDLHYYQHGGFGQVRIKEPLSLGHEV